MDTAFDELTISDEWKRYLSKLTWSCPKFPDFVLNDRNRNKILRKIRLSNNDEGERNDLIAEIHVAWLHLKGLECEIIYEPSSSGPDFLLTSNCGNWYVEVKNIREDELCTPIDINNLLKDAPIFEEKPFLSGKVAIKILEKLRQLRDDKANVLFLDTRHAWIDGALLHESVSFITNGLKSNPDWIFHHSGLSITECEKAVDNLTAIVLLNSWPSVIDARRNHLWQNISSLNPIGPVELSFLNSLATIDNVFSEIA